MLAPHKRAAPAALPVVWQESATGAYVMGECSQGQTGMPLSLIIEDKVVLLQVFACTFSYSTQRIVRNGDRKAGLLMQQVSQATQKGAAARYHDAAVIEVTCQLRRAVIQHR